MRDKRANRDVPREGHPIHFDIVGIDAIEDLADAIESMAELRRCGVIVRGAFPADLRARAVAQLDSPTLDKFWSSPNAGLSGGEIRVIGDAATPTFTSLRGPSAVRYARNAQRHPQQVAAVFGEAGRPTEVVAQLLSHLFGGRPAAPATLAGGQAWVPYSFRALDPGEQIFAHHDNHYGLEVYRALDTDLDRTLLLSWFVTLASPEAGGALVVYGLWGSDPNPPLLATRFLDIVALEQRFNRYSCDLRAGDLVVFNAGRFVHRVTPVEGVRPRLTLGGFLTVDRARTRLAFWS